jgi:hypothetical protein
MREVCAGAAGYLHSFIPKSELDVTRRVKDMCGWCHPQGVGGRSPASEKRLSG